MGGNVASLTQLLHDHPLLLHRIIVDHSDSDTPLHVATMLGHTDFVREILRRNSELALELDSKRCSPLHLASAKGYVEIVKMLLSELDEPHRLCELKDEFGRTPLHVAAMKGRNQVLKELLHHVNVEATRILTYQGETILHLAVKHNRLDTLKLLLANNRFSELLNCKDVDGNTILHLAVTHQQTEIVKYLLGGEVDGMETNVCNKNGSTALDMLLQGPSDWRDKGNGESLRNNRAVNGTNPTVANNRLKKSKKKDHVRSGDWTNAMRSALMVVASLIATVAFQAGLTPPERLLQGHTPPQGLLQETDLAGPKLGKVIMDWFHRHQYTVYWLSNTMAFFSSLAIILLLISGLPLQKRLFMWVLMIIMWVAILSLALTYTSVTVVASSGYNEILFASSKRIDPHEYEVLGIKYLPIMGFMGIGFLLVIIFLGNFLRMLFFLLVKLLLMVKWLVCKCVRGTSTTTTGDGNV